MYVRPAIVWGASAAAMSMLSTGGVGVLASNTLIVPAAPVVGAVSNTSRSGASVQTDVAPLAGNSETTCSSGTTFGASAAAPPAATSAPASGSNGASAPPPAPPPASVPGALLPPPQP